MKPNLRRVLALLLALLLALPSFAFAEDLSVFSGEIDPPVEERGPIELDGNGSENSEGNESNGLTIEPPEDLPEEVQSEVPTNNNAPADEPFTQSVILDSVIIYVTANAGVYPANAALKVEAVEDDSIAQAVETAIGEDGVYTHRLYRIAVTDEDGLAAMPDYQQGTPAARVEGLNLPADARVVMFDAAQKKVFDIDATVNAQAIAFSLPDAAVYDIVTLSPLPKQEEPAEDLGDAEPLDEPALDAEPAEEAEEISEEPEVSAQPVAVAFEVTPETAVVTVRRTDSEEPIPAQADGSFLLLPGDYTYTAEAEGYVSIEAVPFTVADEPLTLSFIMEQAAAELSPYDFDQSQTVGGATITVQAEAGVFPDGARLTVSEPAAVRRMMKAAAKGGEQAAARVTARSYSFDISVTDAEGERIQPAEGTTVLLSFALSEAGDPNLTPRVLHEGVEIPCHVENGAVVAQTDGFSRYTVEFTYDAKQYVLQGDTSVAMSEILSAIGLTGDVTAAEVSDDSLFTVSNATGEWIVTALQPFSTTEWMNVTINGVTYAITVTDSNDDFAQTGTDEYTIYTDAGWRVFCDMVEGGNTFENKTVKLENSITISRMAGYDNSDSDNRPFSGTFDGQGKTLTLDYSGDVNYIAPFPRVVGNAVFRDLKIDGVIESTGINAAGLIGHLYGNVTIERCSSSVEITSNGDSGGFVGLCEHSVSFTDCVSSAITHSATSNNSGFVGWSRDSGYTISFKGCRFDGKLLQKDGTGGSNGCFIGWTGDTKTVIAENCLCAPAALADGETLADSGSATFARRRSNPTGSTTITNCYYTAAFGTEQGARAYAVRAGDYTTVGFGTATNTYNVSGITGYANGIVYDGTFYSASSTSLNLTLGHADREGYAFSGYAASAGTLSGNALTMPANDVTVSAVYEITSLPYIGENGEPQSCTQYTALTDEATTLTGWVVVAQDVNMGDTRLAVSGEARLILCDGVTLTVWKGIQLSDGNTLTIYGQTEGTGKLYAGTTNGEDSTCDSSNAGIGGNSSQKGGKVTITGGAVTAKGGDYGAGIGGGNTTSGGEVTVNGGTVTATGGDYGVGIGGGYNKYNTGTLTVRFGNADDYLKASSYGGTVKVEAGYCVKYVDGNNTPHNFSGTLTDGQKSDIAGRELSMSTAVLHSVTIASTIANGTVTASKDVAAEGETVELTAAPAADYMLDSFSVQANGEAVTVTNNQFAMPGADVTVGAVFVAKPNVTYIDYANGTATYNTLTPRVYTILTADTATLTGWVVVLKDVDMGDTRLEVSGEARLILCDGVTLTAKKGIHLTGDNNSLTIYGQTNGTGKLYAGTTDGEDATCDDDNAGIGGNNSQKVGALTVNGGAVTAKGGKHGAGIGGGDCGAGGEVTVNGGKVEATGYYLGAGIGGCYEKYNTGTLTVSFGNADDYLKANSYSGTVKVEDGHCIKYVDGNNTPHTFTGTLTDDQKSDIAGKELRKALNPHAVSVTSTYNAAIASPVLAEAGATITLTASAGFNITGVTATDGTDQSVTVTEGTGDDAGKWFFTMPDSDVSVSATAALIYNFNDLSVNDSGTAYTIHTSAGWGNFCALLNDAPKGFFTGKTVYLGADIGTAANPVTTMAGDSDHPFTGTFDGQHNTLTISYSGGEVCAPFRYVEGGTIQNLNVAGSITASGKFAGSIIGKQKGSVTIKDCTGSVTIASSVSGDGTHGGLVGHNEAGTLKIEGCVFDGKLLTTNGTTHCGGFVGFAGNKAEITDGLYAPSEPSEDETWVGDSNSATFSRGDVTISTSYYTRAFGTAQGTRVYTVTPADGLTISAETSYLNGIVNHGGTLYAKQDANVELDVTPPTGYMLDSITVKDASENDVTVTNNRFTMRDADVTVTATFKPVEYSITYDLDGGSIPGEGYTVTASFDAPNDYNVVTVKCNGARMDENEDGYSVTFDDMPESLGFYVWCDDYWGEDEEGDLLYDNYYFYSTDSQEPGNGSVTMEEEDDNCGSFTLYYSSAPTSGNPTRYTVEDDAIALRNPVKSHYTFVGWTGSNGTTPETAVTIPRGSTGDKSYAAVWEAERHTITFIDYFDSTVFATITQEYGTAITVPELPEHEGYELLGWSAEIPETMPDWDMTIYAYWKTVEYAITYDLDGGTAGYTGEGYTVSLSRVPNVMREWEFYVLYREEWAHQFEPSFHLEEAMTEAVDVCLHYYENDEYGDEIASVNYRATLSAEDFMTSRTVTLTKDGDSAATVAITWTVTPGTASNPVRYTIQSGDIALLPPTKAGVVFAGWTGSNGETPETSVTIAHGSTGDKSYTANWVQYFTVTFDINGGESDPPEDQTVASGDTAEKPNDPTKEGYRFLGWFAQGAETAFDFTAPITASLELTAHWQKVYTVTITADAGCVVTVTAVDSLDADDGTPVASGDLVDENTLLKVSATPKAGYRLTETPDESYTVNTDLTITAVSEALSYALTLTHDNGAAPTANVSDLAAIPYGTRVTLTAGAANDGYVFVGWYQTNGVQLGAEAEYTRVMYGDMTIEARYKATTHVVTFMANGQERGSFTGSAIAQGDFPADPSPVNGEQFDRWDMTVDEINAELDKGNNVTVTAVFSKVQNHFTVTIYNGEEAAETVACEQTTTIKRRAKDVEGKVFAWWTLDGERFSYNKTASFIATQDCELRAVYTASPVEAEGTATIRTVSYNPETRKLSFNAYLTVPDGSTITAAGLVAASGSGAYNPNETLTTANADYSKALASATGKCAPVDYTWNKTQVSPGDVWYVRARIAYTDSQGIAREIYGERVRVCAGTDYDASEKGTASIRRFSYNESTRKLSFNAYLTVPENTTIVKAGLVAIGSTFDPTTQLLTASNAAYVKSLKDAEGKCAPVDYTWNKTNVSRGDTWYARAYLVYTDAAGREHTVYGELITAVAN